MNLRTRHRKLSRESGMTLIEVMCAIAILVGGLVAVFGSVFSVSEASVITEDRVVAIAELAGVMEELRDLSFDELVGYYPFCPEKFGEYAMVEVTCLNGSGEPMYLPLSEQSQIDSVPNPCEVQVTLTWMNERGRIIQMKSASIMGR